MFQSLGRQMEEYIASMRQIQVAMAALHDAVIQYGEALSGPVPEFRALLEV